MRENYWKRQRFDSKRNSLPRSKLTLALEEWCCRSSLVKFLYLRRLGRFLRAIKAISVIKAAATMIATMRIVVGNPGSVKAFVSVIFQVVVSEYAGLV